MCARHKRSLICVQLASEIKVQVYKETIANNKMKFYLCIVMQHLKMLIEDKIGHLIIVHIVQHRICHIWIKKYF